MKRDMYIYVNIDTHTSIQLKYYPCLGCYVNFNLAEKLKNKYPELSWDE